MRCPICESLAIVVKFSEMFDDRFGCPDEVEINRCTDCGHHFITQIRPDSALGSLYEKYYGRASSPQTKRHSRLGALLKAPPEYGMRVIGRGKGRLLLDVGCGGGEFLSLASALGFNVIGIDVDPGAVESARRSGFDVRVGDPTNNNLADQTFDVITLNQVIEHVEDPIATLSAVRGLLREEGLVFLATPNGDSRGVRNYGRRWIHWHVPFHQHIFSYRSLELAARKAGLCLNHHRSYSPRGWTRLQGQHCHEPFELGVERWPWRGTPTIKRPRGTDTLDRFTAYVHAVRTRRIDSQGAGDCILATFTTI